MYTTDSYFDAISVVRNVIERWESRPVKQPWDSTLPEVIVAALANAGLLK